MKLKLFFLSLISLFTVSVVQASEVFRPLLLSGGIYYWGLYDLGLWFFLLVFIIKCICIRQFLKRTMGQIIFIAALVSFMSTLFGLFGNLLIAAGYSRLIYSTSNWTYTAVGKSLDVFSIGAIPGPYMIYGVVLLIGAVVINVAIEGLVISPAVPKAARKNMIFWLVIANALSLGVVLGSLGAQWYRLGQAPWEKDEKIETTRRVRSRRVR